MKRRTLIFTLIGTVSIGILVAFAGNDILRGMGLLGKNSFEGMSQSEWVDAQMENLSQRDKIAQFFMVAFYPNQDENHFAHIDSLVSEEKIGGLICFQGTKDKAKQLIGRFQSKATVPLLIGIDAEWGLNMRMEAEVRFPYNYTIGAAGDFELTRKIAAMIAQECRETGIHLNFAPVADVNNNPDNPVIGYRSFGEYPRDVAKHVEETVKGMESQGVLTSIKHFPGHGDTDVDSHLDLPVVNNTAEHIDAIDFQPFRAGIRSGASTVMIGHLNVPALDPSGTPASLSKVIITDYLKGKLGFDGLVVSDALGMKAVADRYGKTEVVVKSFEAGCDILLMPEEVKGAIDAIDQKVSRGDLSIEEIDRRCRKILAAKYKAIVNPVSLTKNTDQHISLVKNLLFEKAITVLKNQDEVLPIQRFDRRIIHVSIGAKPEDLIRSMDLISEVEHRNFKNGREAIRALGDSLKNYDLVVTSLHAVSLRPQNDFGTPEDWRAWVEAIPEGKDHVFALFGNPLLFRNAQKELKKMKGVVLGYENGVVAQDRLGQFLMGAFGTSGKLPITVNEDFPRGTGLVVAGTGRLKASQPEEVGIESEKLAAIDSIVSRSIKQGVFPGCQILIAVEGKVIYRKSFGHHTYEEERAVKNSDLYDIASVTKVAGSTLSLMRLESQQKFDLSLRLENYLPELTKGTAHSSIAIKSMMAHQAGLPPWVSFYGKTLTNGQPDPKYYRKSREGSFTCQVAKNLYVDSNFQSEIYRSILAAGLPEKGYKYSDIGYYFIKKIIEKQTASSMDQYLNKTFFQPMGLNRICYNPLQRFSKSEIAPTENDKAFRNQLIHGYVHDQGAALLGGVGGHAGLFSNAGDLAAIMQLFLNKGSYGGVQYIEPHVVERYTACQFCPTNRRGAGFDKPVLSGNGGTACPQVSKASYGHSGFTGTLVWADPEYQVNFVFLSNRVYPDADNWKIVNLNVRTEIQKIVYEALFEARANG